MSLLNISVATANSVYQVSLVVLIVAAAFVFLSAIALIWSSSVRERDTTQRLASLTSANAQATADAAKARADLDDAERQLAQAKAAAATAQKEAADARSAKGQTTLSAAAGREITLDNRQLFISFVETVRKGRVIVQAIASNAEATRFAHQVADMLKGAGYSVQENFGSPTLLGEPPVGVQMKIQSMEAQPLYAGSLQKGLEFIGIDTSGALDPAAGDAVIIFVGTKP